MAEHTPTTEEIREYIAAADRVTAHMFSPKAADAVEAFDRWLAAHDAEVRAGVVAEEPAWEIGYQLTQDDGATIGTGYPYPTVEEAASNGERRAKETNEDYPMYPRVHPVIVCRRKAGHWISVERDSAEAVASHEGHAILEAPTMSSMATGLIPRTCTTCNVELEPRKEPHA